MLFRREHGRRKRWTLPPPGCCLKSRLQRCARQHVKPREGWKGPRAAAPCVRCDLVPRPKLPVVMADPTGAPAAARAATEETSLDRATVVAVSPAPLALGSTNATTPGQASAVVISSEVTVASADSLYTPRPRSLSYGSVDAMAEDDRANPRPGGGSATPNEHDPSLTVESSGPLQQLDGLRSPLEEKKETLNHMFGMHKWKSHVSQRPLEERSAVVKELYKPPTKFRPRSRGGKPRRPPPLPRVCLATRVHTLPVGSAPRCALPQRAPCRLEMCCILCCSGGGWPWCTTCAVPSCF